MLAHQDERYGGLANWEQEGELTLLTEEWLPLNISVSAPLSHQPWEDEVASASSLRNSAKAGSELLPLFTPSATPPPAWEVDHFYQCTGRVSGTAAGRVLTPGWEGDRKCYGQISPLGVG